MKLYSRATKRKEPFTPLDSQNVGVYFCGPTVYDRVHLGNIRSMLVGDILTRTLRAIYPNVTYVRNITDIDDKIIQRATENGETIEALTSRTIDQFHRDMELMNILPPTHEPRATEQIGAIIHMVEELVRKGHAYVSGDVFFDISTYPEYGKLSGRIVDDLVSGARIEVNSAKKHPGDFVLWKRTNEEPCWDSPFGKGRPGWHIECSAMSKVHLGDSFDIHGGGCDLLFPHHENELAQSTCANGKHMTSNWIHVGMLKVNGEKMSKSLGNFITIEEVLERYEPLVLRLFFLQTHYRSEIDFLWEKMELARKMLEKFRKKSGGVPEYAEEAVSALGDDLNTPKLLTLMHGYAKISPEKLLGAGKLIGIL